MADSSGGIEELNISTRAVFPELCPTWESMCFSMVKHFNPVRLSCLRLDGGEASKPDKFLCVETGTEREKIIKRINEVARRRLDIASSSSDGVIDRANPSTMGEFAQLRNNILQKLRSLSGHVFF